MGSKRVSYERCCCGLAFPLIFEFVHSHFAKKNPEKMKSDSKYEELKEHVHNFLKEYDKFKTERKLSVLSDKVNLPVVDAAVKKEDFVAQKSAEFFLSIYGAEAGNLALKTLPLGGLYITGGISRGLKDMLISKDSPFIVYFLLEDLLREAS